MRNRHITRTGAMHLLAQVLLLAVLYAVWHERPLAIEGVWRSVVLVGLVFGQSAIWVFFFYLQDRAEPEPTGYVLVAFVSGMAAASLVALPAEQTFFHLASWMYGSPLSLALGATCVRGVIASFLVYAIVRYGFLPDREFDEPADGVAYGAFIGCGFAAVSNLTYLELHPDFTPFAIAASAVMNVTVYGSVGALVGYLVGRTKFSWRPVGAAHALAIVVGAVLVGGYHVLAEYAAVANAEQPLWAGAGASIAFAVLVLGSVTLLMYRLTARATGGASPTMTLFDPWAIGVGMLLVAGGAYATWDGTRPVPFRDARAALSFTYDPLAVAAGGAEGSPVVTQAAFARHGSAGLPLVFTARTARGATIVVQRDAGSVPVDQLDPRRFLRQAEPMSLTISDVTIGGRRGLRMRYAYLLPAAELSRGLPQLRWAYTDVVPGATDTYAISFDAAPDAFSTDEPVYADVLSTVSWSTP